MRFLLVGLCFSIFSNMASAFYSTDYYEKYNPKVPKLANTPYAHTIPFLIQSGQLFADGVVLTLQSASEIQLTSEQLKQYDLETVIIKIGGKPYKATPKFKKLTFIKKGKKGIFGYTLGRVLTLVYVPYQDKIVVLGVMTQGQYFEENHYRTYEINVAKIAQKQMLAKLLKLLGCHHPKGCKVKSDQSGNTYFYHQGQLIGVLESFGREKILLQKTHKGLKHIATLRQFGHKRLIEDLQGHIVYQSQGKQTLNIRLETLNYRMRLNITNP